LREQPSAGLLGGDSGSNGDAEKETAMKLIVLVIHLFLFDGVEEDLSYIYATMEDCMREKAKKEVELIGFPVERVEAACELQDPQPPPGPTECLPLVPHVSCEAG
jgi:hypothetical protein